MRILDRLLDEPPISCLCSQLSSIIAALYERSPSVVVVTGEPLCLFQTSPAPFLVLKPDPPNFTIAEVNDVYLFATMRTRYEVVGLGIFEAYSDNPFSETREGTSALWASLEQVLASRQPDTLPGLKYDIRRPDGTFEERDSGKNGSIRRICASLSKNRSPRQHPP